MATDKQIEANRQNSQHSTGPSESGKQRSSQNATKHGFTGQTLVLTEAEREPYAAHVISYTTKYAPADGAEVDLCTELADIRWCLHQISLQLVHMNSLLAEATAEQRASGATALASLTALAPTIKSLNTLNLYDQRRRRAANDVEQRLLAMQHDRLKAAHEELVNATMHHQLFKAKGLPWTPAENGFVCSLEEIHALIQRETLGREVEMLRALADNPNDPGLQEFKATLKTLPR